MAGSGNITLKKSSDNSTVEAMAVGGANVSISGTTVTVNPTADLDSSEGYYLQIDAAAFDDASGNSYAGINDTTTLSFTAADVVGPTMTITSTTSGVSSGSTTNDSTINLTFTANEAATGFAANDITVSGGSISSFATVSSTVYTATFTPSGAGATTVDVAGGTFTDAAGNNNSAAAQFTWTYDNVAPTMAITSTTSGVSSGSTTNDSTINLTFTANEAATGFAVGDITVNGGSLSSFTCSLFDSLYGNIYTILCWCHDVDVAGNKFTDVAGNNNNAATQFTWTYDNVNPTLASSTPADNATGVAVDANVVLTFSENVTKGSGNITLYKTDSTLVQTIDVNSGLVTVSGTGVTINPTANLDSAQGYYLHIAATAFDDAVGNSYAGISNSSTLNFISVDTVNPTLLSTSPADNATGVGVGANIVFTFSEAVQAGSGDFKLYRSDNTLLEDLDVTSGAVTFSGSTVTVNPAADLTSLTGYYMKVEATAVDDLTGNSYAGINDTTSLNFTAADVAAPTLSSSSPADNATGVAVGANITLTFNENVAAGSGNITLKKSSDNSTVQAMAVGGGNISISGAVVTINPTANLDSSQGYYVQVDATAIDDTSGNSFAGINDTTTLNFTAADVVAPILSSTSPTDNATGVAAGANIVLTFNENVAAGSGNITLKKSSDNSTVQAMAVGGANVSISSAVVTINPTANLDSSQGYYVQVDATAIDDTSGNSFAGISDTTTLSFTAADSAGPAIASSSPADDATGVAVGANIVLTFDENVVVGSGNITLKKSSDDSTVQAMPVGGNVSASGAVVTINPSANLDSSQGYYIQIAATAFDDASGNSYAGINDTTSLNFTAADVLGPTLSSSSPADNATGVAGGANIVLTFNENVVLGSGILVFIKLMALWLRR